MTQHPDPTHEPHWLRLAAAHRAEPDPATMQRVRARLAARPLEPAWVRWLARPAGLALSAGLLVVSAVAGITMVSGTTGSTSEDVSLVSSMLGDDGNYGLPIGAVEAAAGTTSTDSGEVGR